MYAAPDREASRQINRRHLEPALALCGVCPVLDDCRAWGDETETTAQSMHGVLGGAIVRERLQRRRPRAQELDELRAGQVPA